MYIIHRFSIIVEQNEMERFNTQWIIPPCSKELSQLVQREPFAHIARGLYSVGDSLLSNCRVVSLEGGAIIGNVKRRICEIPSETFP